jgi:hypothetical protein
LRDAQQRYHQAEAARAAAALLRSAASTGGRLGPATPPLPDTLTPGESPAAAAAGPTQPHSESTRDARPPRPAR